MARLPITKLREKIGQERANNEQKNEKELLTIVREVFFFLFFRVTQNFIGAKNLSFQYLRIFKGNRQKGEHAHTQEKTMSLKGLQKRRERDRELNLWFFLR